MPNDGTSNAVSTNHFLFRSECQISKNQLIIHPCGNLRVIICGTRAMAIRYHQRLFMRYAHVSLQVFS